MIKKSKKLILLASIGAMALANGQGVKPMTVATSVRYAAQGGQTTTINNRFGYTDGCFDGIPDNINVFTNKKITDYEVLPTVRVNPLPDEIEFYCGDELSYSLESHNNNFEDDRGILSYSLFDLVGSEGDKIKEGDYIALLLNKSLNLDFGGMTRFSNFSNDTVTVDGKQYALAFITTPAFKDFHLLSCLLLNVGLFGGELFIAIRFSPEKNGMDTNFDSVPNLSVTPFSDPSTTNLTKLFDLEYSDDNGLRYVDDSSNGYIGLDGKLYDLLGQYENVGNSVALAINADNMGLCVVSGGCDLSDFGMEIWDFTGLRNTSEWLDEDGVNWWVLSCPVNMALESFPSLFTLSFGDDHSNTLAARVYSFDNGNLLKDGSEKNIYVDCDKNTDLDSIISGISAKDLFGKDCEVSVSEEERGKYKPGVLGDYAIQITATDDLGQTATATLNIHVIDHTDPVIEFSGSLSYPYGTSVTFEDLLEHFAFTDNSTDHGGIFNANPTITLDGHDMKGGSVSFGTSDVHKSHVVRVEVADASGNKTVKEYALAVTDGVKPDITRKDGHQADESITIGLSRAMDLKKEEIAKLFQASDEVDGACDISVDISKVKAVVGVFSATVFASDRSGNKSTISVPIIVNGDIPPVFVLSHDFVMTYTDSPLTITDLTQIVSNEILKSETVRSVSVDTGEYIGNENNPGDYTISYTATIDDTNTANANVKKAFATKTVTGTFDLNVSLPPSEDKLSWWDQMWKSIGDGWRDFWQRVGNVFRCIFTGKGWHWVNNDEYDQLTAESGESSDDVDFSGSGIAE